MKLDIGSYRAEPSWVAVSDLASWPVDARVFDWLMDTTSLTRRLIGCCGQGFRVRVDSQRWARPLRDERFVLGIRDDRYALVRQVYLLCAGQPQVFARTIVPAFTLTGKEKRLAALGSKPLGAWLFSGRDVTRQRIEFTRLWPGQGLFDVAVRDLKHKPDEIWGRRTLFSVAGKPLLVSEIFLPDILALTPRSA
ncbi:MAG: chorismate--pyruvate lyase [Gammaproteobacteria bacterium]|nr:MAG: chorismate--pyruvate lyase [Gammaproteobacteria bacterium]TND02933.1 MAG: chorismate--pyruvate lyase [Gammaproteobacteria bacterium]